MSMVDQVRDNAVRIAREARHVRIDEGRLEALAEKLKGSTVPAWDHELHFFDGTEKSVLYTLLLDAVNFCFWPSEFETGYNGKTYGKDDGYCALAVAVKKLFDRDEPKVTRLDRLARLTSDEFAALLECKGEVPLVGMRAAHARDLGTTLIEEYDGDVRNLIAAADGDALMLVEELAANFACYADFRVYGDEEMPILKRAQLCVSDIVGSFESQGESQGLGALANADKLTCFADYKLPQLFHAVGALAYAPELDAAIRARVELPEGCEQEVEIRCATIAAVERLKALLAAKGRALSAREIDWLLWNKSIVPGRLTNPHHRTITTSY